MHNLVYYQLWLLSFAFKLHKQFTESCHLQNLKVSLLGYLKVYPEKPYLFTSSCFYYFYVSVKFQLMFKITEANVSEDSLAITFKLRGELQTEPEVSLAVRDH